MVIRMITSETYLQNHYHLLAESGDLLMLNYAVNGDFGEVRHLHMPTNLSELNVPFRIMNAGWHRCNDQYHIHRENGCDDGHLLLFSLNAGGRIKFADRKTVSLPPSSVTWIPPKCKHSYFTASGEIWVLYWLHIQDAAWLQLEDIFQNRPWLKITHMENVSREFEAMLWEKKKTAQEFQITISQRISTIYHLLLLENHLENAEKVKGDELVQNIIRQMEADCQQDWSLPQLSGQYYISVPQLIRRFKSETGMTPYAYLMNIRLRTAEIYLRYTKMPVEEISHKTGFSSTSNFIMQFRNLYGTTPQKYRGNI